MSAQALDLVADLRGYGLLSSDALVDEGDEVFLPMEPKCPFYRRSERLAFYEPSG